MIQQKCSRCKEEKSVSEYRKNRSRKSGLHNVCKPCQITARRLQRHKDLSRDAEHSANRRKRIREADGEMPTYEEMFAVYGKACLICGTIDNIRRDHVIPLSLGGSNRITNIQPLCSADNSAKGNRSSADYRTPEMIQRAFDWIKND